MTLSFRERQNEAMTTRSTNLELRGPACLNRSMSGAKVLPGVFARFVVTCDGRIVDTCNLEEDASNISGGKGEADAALI